MRIIELCCMFDQKDSVYYLCCKSFAMHNCDNNLFIVFFSPHFLGFLLKKFRKNTTSMLDLNIIALLENVHYL